MATLGPAPWQPGALVGTSAPAIAARRRGNGVRLFGGKKTREISPMSRRNFCDEIPENFVFDWKRRHWRALVSRWKDVNRLSAVFHRLGCGKKNGKIPPNLEDFSPFSGGKQVNGAGDEWKRRPIASQMRATLSVYRFHVKVHLQAKKEVEKFRPVSHYAPPPPAGGYWITDDVQCACYQGHGHSIYAFIQPPQLIKMSTPLQRQLSCDVISDVTFPGEISEISAKSSWFSMFVKGHLMTLII
jgi:hypothetical protein